MFLIYIMLIILGSSQDVVFQFAKSADVHFRTQKVVTTKGKITVTNKHYINSSKSLEWDWVAQDQFQILSPQIDSTLVLNYQYHTTEIWIYNQIPIDNKIIFQYLNSQSQIDYFFQFFLNFEGWRKITRSYLYDMNKVPKATNSISKVVVKAPSSGSGSIFFGSWKFVTPRQNRFRSLQMPDVTGFLSEDDYYLAEMNQIDIPLSQPTLTELQSLKTIRDRMLSNLKGTTVPTLIDLQKADGFYLGLKIVVENGTIRGNFASPASCLSHLNTFAKNYVLKGSADSLQKAENLVWLVDDFGFSAGSELVFGWFDTVDYLNGLMLIYPYLNSRLQARVFATVRWIFKMGEFWEKQPTPGWNSDFVHYNLRYMIASIVFCLPSDAESVRWMRGLQRFLYRKNIPSEGMQWWIKPDGTVFHHNSHYIAYLYSFNTYVTVLGFFDETDFQIDQLTYTTFRDAAYNLLIMSNKVDYANSLCGRHPFNLTIPMTRYAYKSMATIGGKILKTGVDEKIAAAYNRVWGKEFADSPVEQFPEGFWQFNYRKQHLLKENSHTCTT